MGAPSSRRVNRVRPGVPPPTFRPGITKLYRERPENTHETALTRWSSSVGKSADTTFKPHIGKVYEALEASGELRVDSIDSRLRWEKINGENAKVAGKAADAGSSKKVSIGGLIRSLIASVQNWADQRG